MLVLGGVNMASNFDLDFENVSTSLLVKEQMVFNMDTFLEECHG